MYCAGFTDRSIGCGEVGIFFCKKDLKNYTRKMYNYKIFLILKRRG